MHLRQPPLLTNTLTSLWPQDVQTMVRVFRSRVTATGALHSLHVLTATGHLYGQPGTPVHRLSM